MSAPYPPPGEPGHRPPSKQMTFTPRQIAGAVLLVIAVIFIVENTERVGVRLIIPMVHAPLWLALLIAAALGVLGTLLVQRRRGRRN